MFEAINVVNKFEGKSLKKRRNSDFVIPRKKRIIDRDLVPYVSSDAVLPGNDVEIITDLDIIELCTLNYDLPCYQGCNRIVDQIVPFGLPRMFCPPNGS